MIRFLANENFPRVSIRLLREAGHDVVAIADGFSGITNESVLSFAATERRVVLTFDRDYGELVYRIGLPATAGVVYFRFRQPGPTEPAERLQSALKAFSIGLEGMFTVLTRSIVRQSPLPRTS